MDIEGFGYEGPRALGPTPLMIELGGRICSRFSVVRPKVACPRSQVAVIVLGLMPSWLSRLSGLSQLNHNCIRCVWPDNHPREYQVLDGRCHARCMMFYLVLHGCDLIRSLIEKCRTSDTW